ncbi:kynureninase [Strigomonas culicis]|uniref:Kynureninase n=1 Tax=Strigomonas culicis TaxID=28005 RepID=S9V9L5_9TRYP|nr:kynureninase [Strigomonas culicis]|eukprot:EPY23656.1 kynureninase [Strigomonas culicis]
MYTTCSPLGKSENHTLGLKERRDGAHRHEHVRVAVVQRHRRQPHHVRRAVVDHHAHVQQLPLQHVRVRRAARRRAALVPRRRRALGAQLVRQDAQGQLRAALLRVRRRDHVQAARRHQLVQQQLHVRGQQQRLLAQLRHPDARHQLQRGRQHRERPGGWRAHLEGRGAIRRLEVVMHREAVLTVVAPPTLKVLELGGAVRVLAVHEGAAHVAGAAVQVLVRAPARKVHVPLVQLQWHVAHRVRRVHAHHHPLRVRRLHDGGDVEQLAGQEVHRRQQHHRHFVRVLLDRVQEQLRRHRHRRRPPVLVPGRRHEQQVLLCAHPTHLQVRRHAVRVAGEAVALHQDLLALALRPVEGGQHQVEVHRQRVHHHHLALRGAHDLAHVRAQHVIDLEPRIRLHEVSLHGLVLPLHEKVVHGRLHADVLQPERVAHQVHKGLTARLAREVVRQAVLAQRVVLVLHLREGVVRQRHAELARRLQQLHRRRVLHAERDACVEKKKKQILKKRVCPEEVAHGKRSERREKKTL